MIALNDIFELIASDRYIGGGATHKVVDQIMVPFSTLLFLFFSVVPFIVVHFEWLFSAKVGWNVPADDDRMVRSD